jgi:hypothetical protein
LRRLAQQFPQSSESAMREDDQRTLRTLGREHLAALQKDLAKIQTTLTPVLNGIGASAGAPAVAGAGAWQTQSEQLLASARRVETLLAAVLGVASGNGASDPPSQLLTAVAQLNGDVEQCQRLLSHVSSPSAPSR